MNNDVAACKKHSTAIPSSERRQSSATPVLEEDNQAISELDKYKFQIMFAWEDWPDQSQFCACISCSCVAAAVVISHVFAAAAAGCSQHITASRFIMPSTASTVTLPPCLGTPAQQGQSASTQQQWMCQLLKPPHTVTGIHCAEDLPEVAWRAEGIMPHTHNSRAAPDVGLTIVCSPIMQIKIALSPGLALFRHRNNLDR